MPRRKRTSRAEDPVLACAILFTALTIALPGVWKVVPFLILLCSLGILFLGYSKRMKAIAVSGISEIDLMTGKEFEQFLWLALGRKGYTVETTPYSGDWGADLILIKDGVRTAVQAKRYAKPVGSGAVQEIVAALPKYTCTQAMVITNSTFTRQAKELARLNHVLLWDRDQLVKELHALEKQVEKR